MILVIDNYDSFTFNLVQYLGELGAAPEVVRNDAVTVDDVFERAPAGIVISPGPKTPADTGICNDVIRRAAGNVPLLGVCLGHQCIGHVYGGEIVRAERLMHGKTSPIEHSGTGIFDGIASPFTATRYHSLLIRRETFPEDALEILAWTAEGEIMGLRHREHELWGVQFHPESILTENGKTLLANFLGRCGLEPEPVSAPERETGPSILREPGPLPPREPGPLPGREPGPLPGREPGPLPGREPGPSAGGGR